VTNKIVPDGKKRSDITLNQLSKIKVTIGGKLLNWL